MTLTLDTQNRLSALLVDCIYVLTYKLNSLTVSKHSNIT